MPQPEALAPFPIEALDAKPAAALQAIADGGYRYQVGAPKGYKPDAIAAVRGTILEVLGMLAVCHVSTLDPGGWPVGEVARFAVHADTLQRPVLYLLFPAGSWSQANLLRDPRLSVEAHHATGFERRREAKGVQLQCIASLVADETERAAAARLWETKFGVESGEEGDFLRIDVLSCVLFNAAGRPQWGNHDFFAPMEAVE